VKLTTSDDSKSFSSHQERFLDLSLNAPKSPLLVSITLVTICVLKKYIQFVSKNENWGKNVGLLKFKRL